jgi:hypothetical protein
MSDISASLPKVATVWKHHKGEAYVVLGGTNIDSSKAEFVPSVRYANAEGVEYTRPVSEWHGKFTEIDRDDPQAAALLQVGRRLTWAALEKLAYAYFGALPVGNDRIRASMFFDNVRHAGGSR